MDSLQNSDDRSKAVQKTPWRVSLDAMKKRVSTVEYIHPDSIPHMTIAVVILDNGYALQGMSAPADPANFNQKLGGLFGGKGGPGSPTPSGQPDPSEGRGGPGPGATPRCRWSAWARWDVRAR